MFQVLKSPRDTEESRIKDLASHIHPISTSIFKQRLHASFGGSFLFLHPFLGQP